MYVALNVLHRECIMHTGILPKDRHDGVRASSHVTKDEQALGIRDLGAQKGAWSKGASQQCGSSRGRADCVGREEWLGLELEQ